MSEGVSIHPTRVAVIASVAMESRLRALEVPAELLFPTTVSTESQQLEEKEKIDSLAEFHERVATLLKDERTTGAAHLYVLEPEALAHADAHAQSTLQALTNAQLARKSDIVAAMLPPVGGYTDAGLAAIELIKPQLDEAKIVTLESLDEVKAYLS